MSDYNQHPYFTYPYSSEPSPSWKQGCVSWKSSKFHALQRLSLNSAVLMLHSKQFSLWLNLIDYKKITSSKLLKKFSSSHQLKNKMLYLRGNSHKKILVRLQKSWKLNSFFLQVLNTEMNILKISIWKTCHSSVNDEWFLGLWVWMSEI